MRLNSSPQNFINTCRKSLRCVNSLQKGYLMQHIKEKGNDLPVIPLKKIEGVNKTFNKPEHSASKASWQAQRLANIHGISLPYASLICSLTGKEGIAHG